MKILPQEWMEFVKKAPVLRVATVSKDGIPHVTPVWFVFDGSVFYIATDKTTKKLKNVQKNKNVSLVMDSYDPNDWDRVKGIVFTGTAELVEASEEMKKAKTLLKEKYPHYAAKYLDWLDGKVESSAVIIKINPSRYYFWAD